MRLLLAALVLSAAGCRAPAGAAGPAGPELEQLDPVDDQASGPAARWSYTIAVDESLERMQLGLCVEGPSPRRLIAGREALAFVRAAQVRGGPDLTPDARGGLTVETLGEHGCVDLDIDLDAAARASGRDVGRIGDTLMIAPDRWLWYPALVPDALEARARFELPPGLAATVPWPAVDTLGADPGGSGWRTLDRTAFGWNAWIALGRYRPLTLEVAGAEVEIAILDGARRASDAGVEAWIRAAIEANAELYGRFSRDRVAVVVIPTPSWGDTPVLFGMARRGGGGSVMLLLNDAVPDEALPGEWVAVHELLHLGMPLVADAWMSEGFVTYYSHLLRARAGLLDAGPSPDAQARAAVEILARGFEDHPSARSLASASANMRQLGSYRRVYWGGAALAFAIDLELRRASNNRRSLDDLMRDLWPLAVGYRRYEATELLTRMDEQTAAWLAAGELDRPVSPSAIADHHLRAKATPDEIQQLRGIAVDVGGGQLRLLADPIDQVEIRDGLFGN